MAPIKIERIVSVSSEDPLHPATNLLKKDYSNKKWKSKNAGERQISVVLQLGEFCKINNIDVGNEYSAFIEILVGKSCTPDEEFQVLLVTSSLMSLQECKYGTNINGVNFFKKELLCESVQNEKWDRIKIVCSQPFNKDVQYGLSFIVFHSNNGNDLVPPPKINIKLKDDKPVDKILKIGGLFENRRKLNNDVTVKGAAAEIRAASTSIKPIQIDKNVNQKLNSPKINEESKPKKPKQITPKTTKNTLTNGNSNATSSKKNLPNLTSSNVKAKISSKTKAKVKEKPFNCLMEGVVFVLSGYENPLRSELRNKAMSMGARYEANWHNSCTHLICAFKNTPKFNQVRGRGKIVKKEWIEDCYNRRIRLPWRRFALDNVDKTQPESEDEVHEFVPKPSTSKRNLSPPKNSSDCDTDEEIEKVMKKQRTKLNDDVECSSTSTPSSTSPTASASTSVFNDFNKVEENNEKNLKNIYEMDTESEDESNWIKLKPEEKRLPNLPPFLKGTTLALLDDLIESDRNLLIRYIKAHDGKIATDETDLNTILYAITEDISAVKRIQEDYPQVIGVKPEWIWRSHDEDRLLSTSQFKVE